MLKKVNWLITVLLVMAPMMAHSYTLTTRVNNLAGQLQVASYPVQTGGSVIRTIPNVNPAVPVVITPAAGYVISKIQQGTTYLAVTPNGQTVTIPANNTTSQTINVWFDKKYVIVTAFAGIGGSVSPSGAQNLQYGMAKSYVFTPAAGKKVLSLSGLPSGAIVTPAVPAAPDTPVTVSITVPAAPVMLSAIFQSVIANAGSPQNVLTGSTVTLDGSASTGAINYAWSQTVGTPVTLSSSTVAQPTFTAAVAGSYQFRLVADDGAGASSTAYTTVTATESATAAAQSQCQDCHQAQGIGVTANVYGKWSLSLHSSASPAVMCYDCHAGSNNGAHPGPVLSSLANVCANCHGAPPQGHPVPIDGNTCVFCHDPHSLAAGGATLTCDSCHGNPPATKTLGVSTYTHTSSNCADCHSVPPTTDATATHRDGKIEILTNTAACSACHAYPPASSSHATAVAGTSPNCSTCHTYTDFNGTTHNNGTVDVANMSCTVCHGMPPAILTVALSGHTGQHLASNDCTMCHGYLPATSAASGLHRNGTVNTLKSGAPHFNNVTSGMYPAAYVTSTSTCTNCHNSNANNQTIRQQWAASGHANTAALPWIDYDFKFGVRGDTTCVRCHTTTGFIAYSTAKVSTAWGVASDKTKEVLTCVGCHSDVANGVVRTVTPNKPFADEATFTNVDVGTSNICMDCHSGRNNGSSIQKLVVTGTDDLTNTSYISPHYLTAGGSLQGKSGFDFPGRIYSRFTDNAHSKVGTADSNTTGSDGPCVACHMSATAKHTFSPVTDTNGVITAITTTTCANCHTDASKFNAVALNANKVAFVNALAVLKTVLTDKGIVVTDNYPYVANKNWGTGQAGANLMGAAFNYKLFATEPGAYAHNPEYAKQLIADSIEAVVTPGHTVTGSDISSYLTTEQFSVLNAFNNQTSSCASCHSFPPATSSHASATTSPLNCATCHTYTGMGGATHNNGTLDLNLTCTSCHGNPPATSFHTGVAVGTCATCHGYLPSDGTVSGNHRDGTVETTCNACHGNPPSALTVAISGHTGTHTNATDCVTCHGVGAGTDATHKNGTVNTTCVACHGNPPTTQIIHVTGAVKYTHSTPAIVYTDCTVCHESTHQNGTVDLKTNDNACSSCHSYPPASEIHTSATGGTSPNCVTCHNDYTGYTAPSHNNGTVNISGDLACDTCHGYPPMTPDQISSKVAGTFNNAKAEDYTGGGAYHSLHLLPTVSAAEGFAPCLPCHPSGSHNQGNGSVVRENVNVFDAADTSFRLNTGLPKVYDSVATTCSNISCHFKPSPAWKL